MKISGELDYRIRYDVEHDLFHAQNVFDDEYITPTFVEYVQKLEAQIEKMKADVMANIKWADKNCDNMWQKLVKMWNQWEIKEK